MDYKWPRVFFCSENHEDDLSLYIDGDIFDFYGKRGTCDPYITVDELNEYLSSLIEYGVYVVYEELT